MLTPPLRNAPTRTLIVSDPTKLTYFARAQAVRAGAAGTWGALSGFGEAMPNVQTASSDNTKTAGALQTVGDLFANLGRSLLGAQTPPPVVVQPEEPSVMPYVVGVGAAALVGVVVWKLAKR